MFEEVTGQNYDGKKMVETITPIELANWDDPNQIWAWYYQNDPFFRRLVNTRARRSGGFINDRGPRHVKNRYDRIGITFAFWLTRIPRWINE